MFKHGYSPRSVVTFGIDLGDLEAINARPPIPHQLNSRVVPAKAGVLHLRYSSHKDQRCLLILSCPRTAARLPSKTDRIENVCLLDDGRGETRTILIDK